MSEFFKKKRMLARWESLVAQRNPHLADWKKITDVIRPSRGQYLEGSEETSKRPTSMLNSAPAIASRTLQAGMIGGASSPAYPWMTFELDDPELGLWGPARQAIELRRDILLRTLARSNFYQILQVVYGDAADFGTGAGIIEPHPTDIITARLFSPGEYAIDVDEMSDIDTLYRKVTTTCIRLIRRWGLEKVSQKVSEAYDKGNYNDKFTIYEVIEPNLDVKEGQDTWHGQPWVKFVFEETNKDDGENNYLEISGYPEWPGFNLRWDIASGNVWGTGPGLLALGDAAALQTLEFRYAQAIEKAVKPPLAAPSHLRNKPISHAPGGVSYYNPFEMNGAQITPIYTMQAGIIQALQQGIANNENRINEVYYKNLFLMLASTDRREITAREVEEKHSEKLLNLGPVLQRVHRDALSNSIYRVYQILDRGGHFPEPPRELKDRAISPRYTSSLAYAQRAAGASSLERFFGFTGNLLQAFPEVKRKIDIMESMDHYADAIGVPAKIIVETSKANAAAQQDEQAMAAQAQTEQAASAAQSAQLLSQTDTTRPSALSFLMDRVAGGM